MPLTILQLKSLKPREKRYKVADGDGLYLVIYPNSGKYWVFQYRWQSKQKSLALGAYPTIGLAEARQKRNEAKQTLLNGQDPAMQKQLVKAKARLSFHKHFQTVAEEWMASREALWVPRYAFYVRSRLQNNLFPYLGQRPLDEITALELLQILRLIEQRGAYDMAHRVLNLASKVFMFGVSTGRCERNPAADLGLALTATKTKHYAHLAADELPEFLTALNQYSGHLQTRLAIKLLMLTFVRTKELRETTWAEIDFVNAEWKISAERMKMRRTHIVPLSTQALEIFWLMRRLSRSAIYVFPCSHSTHKPMSDNAMLSAIRRMGFKERTTGHGFRHTASTILHEQGFDSHHIELQLAHVDSNKIRGTYNHALYLPQRKIMMQWWADYLTQQGLSIDRLP